MSQRALAERANTPLVFTGPSISAREAEEMWPGMEARPPIARDQLYQAREEGYSLFVIIDGAYTQTMAISPREVVDVAKDGATIVGAASMGALRAAECWPAGMYGEGLIYRAYRAGVLTRDDEVAVGTDPDREHRAISVPLVNVRYAVSRAMKRGLCRRNEAEVLVAAAKRIFYPERRWPRIFRDAGVPGHGALFEYCQKTDLKKLDAVRGLKKMDRLQRADISGGSATKGYRFKRSHRYDENAQATSLKRSRPRVKLELLEWLFGSGRFQAHLWALVAGRPELKIAASSSRSEAIRENLPEVLGALLSGSEAFAEEVWEELAFMEELDSELLRMYAVERFSEEAARLAIPANDDVLRQVREHIAIAHGTSSWADLISESTSGYLWGAIPLQWIEATCEKLALARTLAER